MRSKQFGSKKASEDLTLYLSIHFAGVCLQEVRLHPSSRHISHHEGSKLWDRLLEILQIHVILFGSGKGLFREFVTAMGEV